MFTLAKSIAEAAVLYQLPATCVPPATLLVVTKAVYPFGNRITNYLQVVLGLSLALGQLVGSTSMGMDPLRQAERDGVMGNACLHLSNVVNAVIYDAVYAYKDLKDDFEAGVKSVAVAWQGSTKPITCLLSLFEIDLLGAAGYLLGMGAMYFATAVAGTAVVLGSMIRTISLNVPEDCMRWFNWTIWLTRGALSVGFWAEYLVRQDGLSLGW